MFAVALIAVCIALGATSLASRAALAAEQPVTPQIAIGDQDGDGDVDLDDLAQRIRDSKAIGSFKKLSLKLEIDGLKRDLESFHDGKGRSSLAELRQRYDTLVQKLVDLVLEKDSALARDISRSEDLLWAELADAKQFNSLK